MAELDDLAEAVARRSAPISYQSRVAPPAPNARIPEPIAIRLSKYHAFRTGFFFGLGVFVAGLAVWLVIAILSLLTCAAAVSSSSSSAPPPTLKLPAFGR